MHTNSQIHPTKDLTKLSTAQNNYAFEGHASVSTEKPNLVTRVNAVDNLVSLSMRPQVPQSPKVTQYTITSSHSNNYTFK